MYGIISYQAINNWMFYFESGLKLCDIGVFFDFDHDPWMRFNYTGDIKTNKQTNRQNVWKENNTQYEPLNVIRYTISVQLTVYSYMESLSILVYIPHTQSSAFLFNCLSLSVAIT